ncbi:MAG: GNAT family N-acetyltransferase, partial [bacterium]
MFRTRRKNGQDKAMDDLDFFETRIEQTDWQSSEVALTAIRHRVFVEEQGVPEDLEIDEHDPEARHWLAYGESDDPVGCIRMLEDGKVGRMAVLAEYRSRGVASSLLRRVIRYARRTELSALYLDAQKGAVSFYEQFDFEPEGDIFLDAGIDHQRMRLKLSHYGRRAADWDLPAIPEEDRLRQSIDGMEVFRVRARKALEKAEHSVRIFSDALDPRVYNDSDMADFIQQLVLRHPQADIRILIRDSKWVKIQTVALADLSRRLTSHVMLRKLPRKLTT